MRRKVGQIYSATVSCIRLRGVEAVASNEAIEKGQGRMMLLATWLHATSLACLHYAARLQRRDINLSPAHPVAPLLHSNGSVASGGGDFGINLCKTRINCLRLSKNFIFTLGDLAATGLQATVPHVACSRVA